MCSESVGERHEEARVYNNERQGRLLPAAPRRAITREADGLPEAAVL